MLIAMQKIPKVAICISGQLRAFDKCYPSIKRYIFDRIQADIFGYIAGEKLFDQLYEINFTKLIVENQSPLPEYDYSNEHVHTVQGMLQQLHGLYKVDLLRCEHEMVGNFKYDWVIRLRPDLYINSFMEDLILCNNDVIYIPSKFHDYGGYNDRFAFGNSDNMRIYMQRYDLLGIKNGTYKEIFHPETSLKIALCRYGISIKRTDIKYAFCRDDGSRAYEII